MPREAPLPALARLNGTKWRRRTQRTSLLPFPARPKSSSDVTRYAEAFYNMNGCSPFALAAGK